MQDSLSLPEANFLTGWSHGKEALKNGEYDTLKGSFYVNCDFYRRDSTDSNLVCSEYPELATSNVWPPEDLLPGFRQCFEELCTLIIDTAVMVARQCDRYALAKIEGYEPGYLERVVRSSTTTKARLLHYFPLQSDHQETQQAPGKGLVRTEEETIWCTTHVCGVGARIPCKKMSLNAPRGFGRGLERRFGENGANESCLHRLITDV